MSPYADFTYFGLLLYLLVPTVVLGLFGKANARWAFLASGAMLLVHLSHPLVVRPGFVVRELTIALGFLVYQGALSWAFLKWKSRRLFPWAVILSIAPLAAAKFLPELWPGTAFGFLGISYVTFRALDVIFSIHDGVIKSLSPAQFAAYLFFFATFSSGPIDRYRRFTQDWNRRRNREEFLQDLDGAVERVFRGFLYKFILAALVKTYWLDRVGTGGGVLELWSSMYAYSFYLFFDFAGYSAFAIAVSYLCGVHTPENFNLPFLAANIRDFWNRWHMSLSFWFRDHVYMRFLLAASKGKWFKGKYTSSYLGLFLTFGLMGVWHGSQLHYILYGLYHAALLSGYDAFSRWDKHQKRWPEGPVWRWVNVLLTFHAVCFGLLLFSGRLF